MGFTRDGADPALTTMGWMTHLNDTINKCFTRLHYVLFRHLSNVNSLIISIKYGILNINANLEIN